MKSIIFALLALAVVAASAEEASGIYLDGVSEPHFHFPIDPVDVLDRSSPWTTDSGSTCGDRSLVDDCDGLSVHDEDNCQNYYVYKPWKGNDRWVICQGDHHCRHRPGSSPRNSDSFEQCSGGDIPVYHHYYDREEGEDVYLDGVTEPHFHFPGDVSTELDRKSPWNNLVDVGTCTEHTLIEDCDTHHVSGEDSCDNYYVYKPHKGTDRWILCQGDSHCRYRPGSPSRNRDSFEQCSGGEYPVYPVHD